MYAWSLCCDLVCRLRDLRDLREPTPELRFTSLWGVGWGSSDTQHYTAPMAMPGRLSIYFKYISALVKAARPLSFLAIFIFSLRTIHHSNAREADRQARWATQ